MSYILEALKKAQAERQIGETPTIHAPSIAPAAEARPAGSRKALLAGVGVLGGAVVVMGVMLMRQQPGAAATSPADAAVSSAAQLSSQTQPAAALVAPAPAPAVPEAIAAAPAASPAVAQTPGPQQQSAAAAAGQTPGPQQPSTAVVAAPSPVVKRTGAATDSQTPGPQQQSTAAAPIASPAASPMPVSARQPSATSPGGGVRPAPLSADVAHANEARTSLSGKQASAKSESTSENKRTARAADSEKPAASAPTTANTITTTTAPIAAPAPAAPQDEHVQTKLELPEPIQRAIPPITMGGYMYSKNPSDRLILIDKVLRKEGDEVAPGLQLEKLQPKAAIFVFRGYRYKVPL